MRRSLLLSIVALLAACGSGQDPIVEGAGDDAATTTVPATDDTGPTDPGVVTAEGTVPDAGATGATGGDQPTAADGTVASEGAPDDPAATFGPPAAGRYTFRTTGTMQRGLDTQAIDTETVTIVESLGPDAIRQSSASEQGNQTTELRYEQGRVALTKLELAFGGQVVRFSSADGVQFSPVPPDAGHTWSWQLADESGQLVADFTGTTQPRSTVSVLGAAVEAHVLDATIHVTGTYSGFPIDATMELRAWIDPARRTPVVLHQVTRITQPALLASTADTTSELTGFEPG